MAHPLLDISSSTGARLIRGASPETWPQVASALSPTARAFAKAQGFAPTPGAVLIVPDAEGAIEAVVLGDDPADPFAAGKLPAMLPEGAYAFAAAPRDPALATLAWLLGSYAFTRYGAKPAKAVRLVPPDGVDADEVSRIAAAVAGGRDLINTPANDLGPEEIEAAARRLAEAHKAEIACVVGDDLIAQNFPMIHAVGRASPRLPRLIDMRWGAPGAPKVTVVGKGVAFDTGGLDIKPGASMLLMKKDMGGAAAALALADMIMGARLPVRLRVLIPAVENAISGSAFRPGDVLPSRKGLTVEIGNTDAEGRLILADALALADEEEPDLIVDFATLTGAARTALGPDVPPLYTEDDALAADLARLGMVVNDPVWRLPLWPPYARMLESKIADVNHVSSGPMAGSITAALFLRRFAPRARAHVHFDIYAWTPKAKPGRPEGGEVQGARVVYALLRERYGGAGPDAAPR
jgi:leucyl aminopeptidase